jgi:hypothetical protein
MPACAEIPKVQVPNSNGTEGDDWARQSKNEPDNMAVVAPERKRRLGRRGRIAPANIIISRRCILGRKDESARQRPPF